MRTFLGIILGCLLTIAGLYIHDTMVTSTVASGASTAQGVQIVNWDAASHEWGRVKAEVHTAWVRLTGNVG